MPVSIRVVALTVGLAILFFRHVLAMQAMRRGETIAAMEVGFHAD
jgi:hypothetical protein